MEAVKIWARSIFLLAVLSSTVLLIIPRSMQKQSRFVVEMLLLLCIVAPLGGLISAGAREALAPQGSPLYASEDGSLGRFYADETARRVFEIGEAVGLSLSSVNVSVKDSGFTMDCVTVHLANEPEEEKLEAFSASITAYLGIGKDKLRVVMEE